MAERITIVNRVLSIMGKPAVASIDTADTQTVAAIIDQTLMPRWDVFLTLSTWKFARKYVRLAQSTVVNPKWTYFYTIPSDFIRPVGKGFFQGSSSDATKLGDPIIPCDRENIAGGLYSNKTSVWMHYISNSINPWNIGPLYREALAYYIAIQVAPPVLQDMNLVQFFIAEGTRTLIEAKAFSPIEGVDFVNIMPQNEVNNYVSG